jgi:hypothetical protein
MDRKASGARLELAGRVRREARAQRLDARAVGAEVLAPEPRGRAQVDHAGSTVEPELGIVGEAQPAGLELGVQVVGARRHDAGAGRRLDRHAQARHGGRAFTREAEGRGLAQARCGWSGQRSAWLEAPSGVVDGGLSRPSCTPRSAGGEGRHDKLLALTCTRGGFFPSCGARLMSQTAAHLVDHALALPPGRSPGTSSPRDCSCLAKGRASRASWPVRPARPRPSMADRTLSGRHGCSSGKR